MQEAWRDVPIVWLAGVRRSGKTTLAQSLEGEQTIYVNCDPPDADDAVRNPALFFKGCNRPIIIFDEIHQLNGNELDTASRSQRHLEG